MLRTLLLAGSVALAGLAGCTPGVAPATDPATDSVDAKEDGIAAAQVDAKLAPMLAFLRDDKNLVKQLGPEGTDAINVKKTVKVVRYGDFGKAVEAAARPIARKYYVGSGTGMRRAYTIVDLMSVGDMYFQAKTGYGDDSFIDKLIVSSKRSAARNLATNLLPEAAFLTVDYASETSTGNYIIVLGDMTSGQAIVMTIEYEVA